MDSRELVTDTVRHAGAKGRPVHRAQLEATHHQGGPEATAYTREEITCDLAKRFQKNIEHYDSVMTGKQWVTGEDTDGRTLPSQVHQKGKRRAEVQVKGGL